MREILFRGKRLDNGEWEEGYLVKTNRNTFIMYPNQFNDDLFLAPGNIFVSVAPSTVGQYTGLKDKNGKRIFEGDIVRSPKGTVYRAVWSVTAFYLRYDPPHGHGLSYNLTPICNFWNAHGAIIEVIGNIHDNPELLGGNGNG